MTVFVTGKYRQQVDQEEGASTSKETTQDTSQSTKNETPSTSTDKAMSGKRLPTMEQILRECNNMDMLQCGHSTHNFFHTQHSTA